MVSPMTPADVARAKGVALGTVYRWISTGVLPATRVGPRLLRIDPADVAAMGQPVGSDA